MITIEKLKSQDMEELLNLYKELTSYENNLEESVRIYEDMLNDDKYILLVAKEDNKIVGSALGITCLLIGLEGKRFLVIEDVIVRNELRGKGIGKLLMSELDKFAVENNCAYSILVSSGKRVDAHHFYEKLGYTEDVKGFRRRY